MKSGYKTVMTLAGLMLIGASVLKAHQLLTEPIVSEGFWESWLFFVIQIPLELGLGIWLVSGLFRKAGWLLGLCSFGLFIAVTLHKHIIGAESCGCFGRVHVPPWITLLGVDVPFFLGFLFFPPKGEKFLPPPWPSARHFFGVAIPAFIILGALVPILVFNKPGPRGEHYEVLDAAQLTAGGDRQAGGQWSLLDHIDVGPLLCEGVSVVLLYHSDCPDCRAAIPVYDKYARELGDNVGSIHLAFIEVPPYGPPEENPIPPDTVCIAGRMDESKKWFLTTPFVVVVVEGQPVKAWQGRAPELEEILTAVFDQQ